MYHITEQYRKWNIKNIMNLAATLLFGAGYLDSYPMSKVKGKSDASNVLDILKTILEPNKKYTIGDLTFTGKAICEKVEMYLLKNQKAMSKCPVIADGRHRAVAVTVAMALGGEGFSVDPTFVEKDESKIRSNSFETNVAHDMATPLGKIDKLKEVIGLIESGEASKEADIQKLNLSRYQAQEYWAKADLVRGHGFTHEEAIAVSKEDARNAAKEVDARAWLEENAKEKKGAGKVLPGGKMRDAMKLMNEAKIDQNHSVYRMLNAIVSADEVGFKDLIREIVNLNKQA